MTRFDEIKERLEQVEQLHHDISDLLVAVEDVLTVAVTHKAERGYGDTNFSYWRGYDEAMRRVERTIRDALDEREQ